MVSNDLALTGDEAFADDALIEDCLATWSLPFVFDGEGAVCLTYDEAASYSDPPWSGDDC